MWTLGSVFGTAGTPAPESSVAQLLASVLGALGNASGSKSLIGSDD